MKSSIACDVKKCFATKNLDCALNRFKYKLEKLAANN